MEADRSNAKLIPRKALDSGSAVGPAGSALTQNPKSSFNAAFPVSRQVCAGASPHQHWALRALSLTRRLRAEALGYNL